MGIIPLRSSHWGHLFVQGSGHPIGVIPIGLSYVGRPIGVVPLGASKTQRKTPLQGEVARPGHLEPSITR